MLPVAKSAGYQSLRPSGGAEEGRNSPAAPELPMHFSSPGPRWCAGCGKAFQDDVQESVMRCDLVMGVSLGGKT